MIRARDSTRCAQWNSVAHSPSPRKTIAQPGPGRGMRSSPRTITAAPITPIANFQISAPPGSRLTQFRIGRNQRGGDGWKPASAELDLSVVRPPLRDITAPFLMLAPETRRAGQPHHLGNVPTHHCSSERATVARDLPNPKSGSSQGRTARVKSPNQEILSTRTYAPVSGASSM
jgi:hypothetical protein